ncbi:Structural protein [Acetobacteraceae bacterium EV16G]|uniref:Structural protein n=1 Tax=Sorlinia euscelidii TaxID=3081148 RepID=A0ABU7U122_9PROT
MAQSFITSADAIFTLTIQPLFSAPITLENWGTDRAWEVSSYAATDSRMSIDGYLNKGFQHRPVEMSLTLEANSPSNAVFEAIEEYQKAMTTVVILGGELRLPGLHRKYTFDDGHVIGMTPLPGGASMLEARTYNLRWRRIIPAGI